MKVTNLTSGNGQDTSSPFEAVTNAINTVQDRLYILCIAVDDTTTSTQLTVSSISTAGGITWTFRDRALADSSNGRSLELWTGVCTSTSSSVQFTITFGSATADATWAYILDEVEGIDTSGTIVQVVKTQQDASSPITATLAAFGKSNNIPYAVALNDATASPVLTEETGWIVTDSEQNTTGNILIKAAYNRSTDTSVTFSGSGTSDDYSLIAIEIKTSPLITMTNKASGSGTAGFNPNTWSTASITTVTDRLYFLTIICDTSGIVSINTGQGITWSLLTSLALNASDAAHLYSGVCTAGGTGTWTVTMVDGFDGFAYIIDEATGNAKTSPEVQSTTGSSSSSPLTLTLSAFGATDNATYMVTVGENNNPNQVKEVGWENVKSIFTDGGQAGFRDYLTSYTTFNDTSPSNTFSSNTLYGIAVEIKAANIVTVSLGSIALTSLAATSTNKATSDLGTLTLTGLNAITNVSNVSLGSLTLTSFNATSTNKASTDLGVLTLTALNALTNVSNIALGTLALIGLNATSTNKATSDLGALTLTSFNATSTNNAKADLGTLTLTGLNATSTNKASAGLGILTLTSLNAITNVSNVALGTLTLSALNAITNVSRPDLGVISLTSLNATATNKANTDLGMLTLTSFNATSTNKASLDLGTITLTGLNAITNVSRPDLGIISLVPLNATATNKVSSDLGILTLISLNAITNVSNISLGSLILTGLNATSTNKATSDLGAISLVSLNATSTNNSKPDLGSLALTPFNATSTNNVKPDIGMISVIPLNATGTNTVKLEIGTLALTALNAITNISNIALGNLTLTGLNATGTNTVKSDLVAINLSSFNAATTNKWKVDLGALSLIALNAEAKYVKLAIVGDTLVLQSTVGKIDKYESRIAA